MLFQCFRIHPSPTIKFIWIIILVLYGVSIEKVSSYAILGGLDSPPSKADDLHVAYLRHLDLTIELERQRYEKDGRLSLSGTVWEASHVLADYITHPKISTRFKDKSLLELGSGLGLCALAASHVAARIIATDSSPTSLCLLKRNTQRYSYLPGSRPVSVIPLHWGEPIAAEIVNLLQAESQSHPDFVIASDVVYHGSDRRGLQSTLEALCGPDTTVILAHTWRADPREDDHYFKSLNLQCREVNPKFFPHEYQWRGSDGRTTVSIFEFCRDTGLENDNDNSSL